MRKIKRLIMLCLIIFLIACSNKIDNDKANDSELEKFIGKWTGAFEMSGRALAMNITFDQNESTFRYVMQDDASLPLKNIKVDNDEITFTVGSEKDSLTFNGKISDEQIAGFVKIDQYEVPFTMYRYEIDIAELIEIESTHAKLTGELLLPETNGPHPVLLIIPGTTDRNGNSGFGENNSLKYLAESLADKGIATVRYDKRGVGDNKHLMEKDESILFDQLVEDAEAWTRFLIGDNRFTKVGIMGYEQGALEAMIVADENDVELMISIAGAGRTYGDILADDLLESLKDDGQKIIDALKAGEMVEEVQPEFLGMFHPDKQAFLISMININPAEIVAKQSKPYLIVHGENDVQLDVTEAEILSKANRSAELLIIPEMNHVLRVASPKTYENMLTYTNPTLPLADGLVEGIFNFLEENNFN